MPVKPVDTVPDWGSAGNYPASVYPVNLPWGDPNPVGGLPTPWSGQPRLNATAFTSFVNNGFSPQIPTDASSMNEWDRRIGVYVNWVILGTSAADADAHIMETNGAGLSSALAYEATASFQGVGGTQAPLANGATIPAGKTMTLGGPTVVNGAFTVFGAAGGSIASDPTAVFGWNGVANLIGTNTLGGRTNLTATTSLFQSDLSTNGSGHLRWRDAVSTTQVHRSPTGWFKGLGAADTAGPLANVTLDTSTAVAPEVAGDVEVVGVAWVQRVIAGPVTVSLDAVGVGQIGTATAINVPASGGLNYTPITFTRVRAAANTTPRVYRLTIAGGGSNVTCKALSIRVTPGAS